MMINKYILAARCAVIVILLALPYYIYSFQYFLGGDDSRIYTIFPLTFLQHIAQYSWLHFSSFGTHTPQQFFLPLTALIFAAQLIFQSTTVVAYLCISVPLILGFIYAEKLLLAILPKEHGLEAFIGALCYIFSPIMVLMQWSNGLTAIWVLGFFPAMLLYYVRYLQAPHVKELIKSSLLASLLSVAVAATPWLLGYIVPLIACLPIIFLLKKEWLMRASFWYRSAIFITCIFMSQAFWLIPSIQALITPANADSLANALTDETAIKGFTATVEATAVGNVTYPILNLFHRQLVSNFNWAQLTTFTSYYDYIVWLNFIFPAIFAFALFTGKKSLSRSEYSVFLICTLLFACTLYFFTVNIGALKSLFLSLGTIPGFPMFRNHFDKFGPSYVLYFSGLLAWSLVILRKRYSHFYKYIVIAVLAVLLVDFVPVKQLLYRPLWTTEHIYSIAKIPTEYQEFMNTVQSIVPATTNILSLPLNNANYGIVTGPIPNHAYIGRSLTELFADRLDFSSTLSFPSPYGDTIRKLIQEGNYLSLENILQQFNIGYVLLTKNIPDEIRRSYLFDAEFLASQEKPGFTNQIQKELLRQSSEGNFQLYKLKEQPSLFSLPTTFYEAPTERREGSDSLLEILPVINNDTAVIPKQALPSIPNTKKLYSPTLESIFHLQKGAYTITPPKDENTSIITFNPETKSLEQSSDIKYKLNTLTSTTNAWQPILENIDVDNTTLEINGQLFSPADIHNLSISNEDKINVFTPTEENLFGDAENIFTGWGKGDCRAHNSEDAVSFEQIDEGVRLITKDDHEACLYKTITFPEKTLYVFESEYRGNGGGDRIALYINNEKKEIPPTPASEEWQRIRIPLLADKDTAITSYIYSGISPKTAASEFRNITLTKHEQTKSISIKDLPTASEKFSVEEPKNFSLAVPVKTIPLPELKEWATGDCGAIDTIPSTTFTPTASKGMELKAINGHNACLHTVVNVDPNYIYQFDIDAMPTNHTDVSFYVGFNNNKGSYNTTRQLPENVWHHNTFTITVPNGSTEMLLYIYSGATKRGEVATEYNTPALKSYPKIYKGVTLYQAPEPSISLHPDTNIEVTKISPIAYRIHGEHMPRQFFLQFKEAFDPGWNIYPTGTYTWYTSLFQKPTTSAHYPVNQVLNGWWINHEEICTETNCQGPDDNYSADLLVIFTPQRSFIVGSVITLATLLLLCVIGLISFLRKKLTPTL